MDRRRKVELFEEIRREYRFGAGTIQGVAKKLKTHRRMVRQALANAIRRAQLLADMPSAAMSCLLSLVPRDLRSLPASCHSQSISSRSLRDTPSPEITARLTG
jgi:hypothetical protein